MKHNNKTYTTFDPGNSPWFIRPFYFVAEKWGPVGTFAFLMAVIVLVTLFGAFTLTLKWFDFLQSQTEVNRGVANQLEKMTVQMGNNTNEVVGTRKELDGGIKTQDEIHEKVKKILQKIDK